MLKKRRIIDTIINAITYLFSSLGVLILVLIFAFIFSNGAKTFSFKMLTSDYYAQEYTLSYNKELNKEYEYESLAENEYFSTKWGVAFKDVKNLEGVDDVVVSYIDISSPLKSMNNASSNEIFSLAQGQYVSVLLMNDNDGNVISTSKREKAEKMITKLNKSDVIVSMTIKTTGGGIRGSIITTLYLILITLIISLPFGIGAAIYLSIYSKNKKLKNILEVMIDLTGGIPSIIFGLIGVIIFVPVLNKLIGSDGRSIMAGAFTLAIMLLPTIIKTTKESLDVIPSSLSQASLALGASQTQTTFKVILPNAIPGILTATLLSIGRIIGESAALIFVVGVQVSDDVKLNQGATSLATHIWYLMGGENPNYSLACAISIVILTLVLLLNIIVKLIGKKLNKFEVK